MNFLEKHSKKIAVALCFATCVPVVSAVYAFEAQPGWHGEGSDRYYILETSREQAVGWLKLDEGTYYFNDEADMQFGWQEIDGAKYYFDESGKMTVGEAEVDGVAYLFQEDGKMLSGWNDDHLYGENGYPLTNQFLELKDGTVYYLDENGKKATGWQTIDDKRYYFQEDGTLARDMVREGKEVYYLNEDGYVYTGWRHVNGNSYYFDKYGMMYTDMSAEIDGEEYVFDSNGVATSKADLEKAEAEAEAEAQADQETQSSSSSSYGGSTSSSGAQSSSANRNGIVQAALAQVGNIQDCTMLVTNALAANGIYYHGWPSGYLSLGTVTNNPTPGDLIYYADGGMGMAHIAVYIGNGQAVHGGYNGNQTVVSTVNLGSGPVYIRLN